MKSYQNKQIIGQLEKRKGGYFFLKVKAEIVNQYHNKRHTRFICTLDNKVEFRCGLNHLGDGNFFIILSTKNLQVAGKTLGDIISFKLDEDPNPLGVEMPEVLEAVLEQDDKLNVIFESLTPGKKRNIIHTIARIKNIDLQIMKIPQLIIDSTKPRQKKPL